MVRVLVWLSVVCVFYCLYVCLGCVFEVVVFSLKVIV